MSGILSLGMLTDCYKIDDIFTIAFYWKMENNSFSFFQEGLR
ncbi:hypothetical protein BN426_1388 [Klebsiella pneumoniae subsp. pneumoniae ST258-K26BO]|nr:hypothetical protein CSC25_5559 [Klebsiella pneumoniae]CCM81878.1 hypothetical protein BN426_1388 [Klebsiella pneumoniae subsp. pneumoniae ST258-K26BO]CCM89913.1 hypothetical protein BN427_3792 [Klebsiella pneumoniae subsp. pneumoniae ST258-K28BO]